MKSNSNQHLKKAGGAPTINLVLRAWTTVLAVTGAGVIAAFILSRPETVNFEAKFKCKSFQPGAPIDITLDRCNEIKFGAERLNTYGLFSVPRDSKDDPQNQASEGGHREIQVAGNGWGGGIVSAELSGEYLKSISLNMPLDGVIDLPAAKRQDPFGAIRATGSKIGIGLNAWSITAKTPLDEDYTGFVTESNQWLGEFVLDGYADEQGGVPNVVSLGTENATGSISISGAKNEISGAWVAIDFPTNAPLKKLPGCRLSADDLSACELTIDGESADLSHSVDRLQCGIISGELGGIKIYQDSSEAYIEVNVSGVAQSIRVNNAEQIESKFEKLLSRPTYKAGIIGVVMGFVLLSGGIVLKRALETLAEIWLPKKE